MGSAEAGAGNRMSRLRRLVRDLRQLTRSIRREDPDVSYDELRRREQLYRLLAENAQDIIWLLDLPDDIRYVSPACKEILGWSPEEQLARTGSVSMLTEDSAERAAAALADGIRAGAASVTFEAEHRHADGHGVWCEVRQRILRDASGRPVATVGVTRDISEKRTLQAQLAEAQKREAIGALAGGVAHDFNNFLTVIIGALELFSAEVDKDDPNQALLADALEAAEHSSALTSQLLSFSRHQPTAVGAVDVNDVLRRSDELLRRIVTERIRLEVELAPDLAPARADEYQIQQILVNLVMNARDAIAEGGTIRITTAPLEIEPSSSASRDGLTTGRYLTLSVSDDGRGMSDAECRQATEPFFTTKPKGHGTGLGLAMVKNIVEQGGGGLTIRSSPGLGTTVAIRLPVAVGTAAADARSNRAGRVPGAGLRSSGTSASARILVVEDEEAVRAVVEQILRGAGFTTDAVASPAEALALLEQRAGAGEGPDLVVTDLVMPGISGSELAERVRAQHPGMPFVVMSGYAESRGTRDSMPGPLLRKPFHANELLRLVRRELEPEDRPAGGD